MSKPRADALEAILDIVRELPPELVGRVVKALAAPDHVPVALEALASTSGSQRRLRVLTDLLPTLSNGDRLALPLALEAASLVSVDLSSKLKTEIAWTGPSTEAVPVRRVDQVLYQMLERAKSEVLLVTYAAYKAERALDLLKDASERGVGVTLVLELAAESGGKISFDGLSNIRARVPRARVCCWPLDRREKNALGQTGTMHVKCVIVDRQEALVSSANLTDHALELNMELGLVVHGDVPRRLASHYDQLMVRRDLTIVAP